LDIAMSDFWWLTLQEKRKYIYIELVYHPPLAEEDDSPRQSFSSPYLAPVTEIGQWRANHQNTNIYRSLKVWKDQSKTEALSGPFLVDIDNENGCLDDALTVTREAVTCVLASYNVKQNDIRVFFTGHKGFNIEILPSALGIVGTPKEQENRVECRRKEIIKKLQESKSLGGGFVASYEDDKVMLKGPNTGKELSKADLLGKTVNVVSPGGTVIDRIHEYIRLHRSINKWIECGVIRARKKVKLTLGELNSLPLEQIVAKSTV
jgi:hypothetical protein